MRRTLSLIALIASLVLSPIGAAAHAYQHYGEGDPHHPAHESGPLCELCTAFVALEQVAAGPQSVPLRIATTIPDWSACASGVIARTPQFFLQRGPPSIL
jgi:hypothetical protein